MSLSLCISLYLSITLYISLYISPYLSISLYISLYLSISLYVYVCLCQCLCLCPGLCLYLYLHLHLQLQLHLHLNLHLYLLYLYLYLYLYNYTCTCTCTYIYICIYIYIYIYIDIYIYIYIYIYFYLYQYVRQDRSLQISWSRAVTQESNRMKYDLSQVVCATDATGNISQRIVYDWGVTNIHQLRKMHKSPTILAAVSMEEYIWQISNIKHFAWKQQNYLPNSFTGWWNQNTDPHFRYSVRFYYKAAHDNTIQWK